ncbi:MAG: bifunctional (p)ppGpp synthetase/guanosine-3',5'-bis(diphosphate) 3'-pyrophosphohydrolase, partial [Oscillospiraceae bacterium]|nr:bifunctional (p)ppGpp synthetase/guanosine-3',5'-bis(diphosphate) 3'-pyrophosphohydrolase [Oscillospiraceae bacterium]
FLLLVKLCSSLCCKDRIPLRKLVKPCSFCFYHVVVKFLRVDFQNETNANAFMNAIQSKITSRLAEVGIHGSIYGRVKHIYSIYRKMRTQNKTIEELYDLYAFRVIVDNIADCYNVLGHIHDLFNPIPGRFKDYISTPKPNMYQSLHTTVIGTQGVPFEVQIRTWDMHQTAEYGVAAHWKYKQHVEGGSEKEFEWVRRLLENQQDTEADDYIHSLKIDMFDDEVFVFTPKGKVISLPAGSTPIDFAYAIHSAVGNSMIGAKVNNRIASYDEPLHNGDIVEVLTSKSAKGPSRDWLNICRSNQARIKIKQWFKKEKREENIIRGKASFEAELRRLNIDPDLLQTEDVLSTVLKKVSFDSLDDMYAAIGFGGITATKAVNRVKDELVKAARPAKDALSIKTTTATANTSGVVVEDIDSCMIKFSRCCMPVPGDDIIGFITKGYGVSVHRCDCPNAKPASDPENAGRWVKVTWAETPDSTFTATLDLQATDRDGLMLDVATVLTSLRVRIIEIAARSAINGVGLVRISIQVHSSTELESIRNRLRGISGVHEVARAIN